MPIYRTFRSEAIYHLDKSLTLYTDLQDDDPEDWNHNHIIEVVLSLHIATENVLKDAIKQYDPALLLRTIDGDTIRGLRAEQLDQGAPSIFTLNEVDTHTLDWCLRVADEVIPLDDTEFALDAFRDKCKRLTNLRDQIVHAELYGDQENILDAATQVYSGYLDMLEALNEDFLPALEEIHPRAEHQLRAIQRESDIAWEEFSATIQAGEEYGVECVMYTLISPGGTKTQIHFAPTDWWSGNSLMFVHEVPPSDLVGFMGDTLAPQRSLVGDGPGDAATESTIAGSTDLLAESFQKSPYRSADEAEDGLTPQDDGVALIDRTDGIAIFHPERGSAISLQVLFESVRIEFSAGDQEGRISGEITPQGGEDEIESVAFAGPCRLETEMITENEVVGFPVGSTMRHFTAEVRIGSPRE